MLLTSKPPSLKWRPNWLATRCSFKNIKASSNRLSSPSNNYSSSNSSLILLNSNNTRHTSLSNLMSISRWPCFQTSISLKEGLLMWWSLIMIVKRFHRTAAILSSHSNLKAISKAISCNSLLEIKEGFHLTLKLVHRVHSTELIALISSPFLNNLQPIEKVQKGTILFRKRTYRTSRPSSTLKICLLYNSNSRSMEVRSTSNSIRHLWSKHILQQ